MAIRTYTIEGRGEPTRLLVLMHGWDANEFHLAAYGPLMDPDARYLVVAPRGPVEVSANGVGWYPLDDTEVLRRRVEELDALLDHLCERHGFQRGEAVVGGFSQGALLAVALGIRKNGRPPLAGVISLCGFLPPPEAVEADWKRAAQTRFLVQRGTADPYIDAARARELVRTLEEHGATVTAEDYPMGHDNTLESLAGVRDWLRSLA